MRRAWEQTERRALKATDVAWTVEPVSLPSAKHLQGRDAAFFLQGGASKLAWLHRVQAGHRIDATCLALGPARILHMLALMAGEIIANPKAFPPSPSPPHPF
jgi:hypothetical protein